MKVTKEEIDKTYFYNYVNSFIQRQLKYRSKVTKPTIKERLCFKYNIFLNLIFLNQLKKIYK